MSAYNLSAIIQLLNPDNTISAHRMLAHAVGMTETIIYSALISKQTYYSKNGMLCEGGWFYSTICDLQESTTFAAKAQKTAINHLIAHGMIECEYKGMPAKRYFRIVDDTENLMRLISEGVTVAENIVGISKEKIAEKSQQRSDKQQKKKNAPKKQERSGADLPKRRSKDAEPCSDHKAAACSCPKAGTCSYPSENKTKDNIKPKKNNPKRDQSVDRSERKEKTNNNKTVERTDKPCAAPMTFCEVLEAIGINRSEYSLTEPKSERHFDCWNEKERNADKCSIPYYLKNDKRAMKAALRYLCGYSYYFCDDTDEKERSFWETVICSIADMTEKDSIRICGQVVRYYEIIDRLNEIIKRYSLADCFMRFEEKWQTLLAEKEIKHPKAYLKSCLWNWLCDYELEEYNEQESIDRYFRRT